MTDSKASEDAEIDVEKLRTELDQIKDAMGIQQRYPGRFQLWLVYGVLVAIAATGSQLVVLYELPWWGHWVSWGVTMGAGGIYQGQGITGEQVSEDSGEGKPDIWLHYVATFGYALVVLAIVSPLLPESPATTESYVFSIIVGGVGLSYIVVGNSLKAYYIRRLDRFAFYIGGIWMFVLAALIPYVDVLQTWGYAAFGIVFGFHAVASYLALRT